jgi:6-phosphogluconolactonase
VTLTFAALRAARRTLFLVSGGTKAAIVRRILVGEADGELPAARAAREAPHALWLLDRAAAADLEG